LKHIYLAGPMTGYKHHNVDAFRAYQRYWQALGWIVETPFEANNRVWERYHGRPFAPETDSVDYGHWMLPEIFAEDIATVCRVQAVALLPGWQKSEGAKRELAIATLLNKPIYDALTGERLNLTCHILFS